MDTIVPGSAMGKKGVMMTESAMRTGDTISTSCPIRPGDAILSGHTPVSKFRLIRLLPGAAIFLLCWFFRGQGLCCEAASALHMPIPGADSPGMRLLPYYPPYHGIYAQRRHFLCEGEPATAEEMRTHMAERIPPVETVGKVQQRYVNRCQEMLFLLPESVRYLFMDYGWHFYVTAEDIAVTEFQGEYTSVKGLTDVQSLYIKVEDRDNATSTTIFHEFGHFLDYCCNFPSERKEFLTIMEQETETAGDMGMDYGLGDNEEYFAESFLWYLDNPEKMQAHIPLTYKFIERCLTQTAHTVHQAAPGGRSSAMPCPLSDGHAGAGPQAGVPQSGRSRGALPQTPDKSYCDNSQYRD